MIGWYILGAIIYLVLCVVIASMFRDIAAMKGHDARKYFWVSLLLGLPGWLMVAALPDRNSAPS